MTIACACGCDQLIDSFDSRGRSRTYAKNHGNRASSRSGGRTWNKGLTYTIAKRSKYATRGSWSKALHRLFPDQCMRCGWNEGACDCHHIIVHSDGGENTLDNGIILCPNCHRLYHFGRLTSSEIQQCRDRAIPRCPVVLGPSLYVAD